MALFSKKMNIYSPVAGKIIKIENVQDEMFANKILGDGFAVEPFNGHFKCPIDGKVVMASENGYAFGIKGKNGIEILIHIGIDTVELNGKGFKMLLKEGQHVKYNDEAVEMDMEFLKKEKYPLTTMVVITSGEKIKELKKIGEDVTYEDIVAIL